MPSNINKYVKSNFLKRIALLLCVSVQLASTCSAGPRPKLTGKLIFQRSTPPQGDEQAPEDAELYLYDFDRDILTNISQNWKLRNAINATFSPDGKAIVFTAISPAEERDIFCWQVGSQNIATNLTAGNNKRDEDPKFDPFGMNIIFKQNNRIAILDANGNITRLPVGNDDQEVSGPCFASDGKHILFWEGAKERSDIYSCNLDGSDRIALASTPNVSEYFPVAWKSNIFLYTRWLTTKKLNENPPDQIFAFDMVTANFKSLPFNQPESDASDPCPIDENQVIFSSTRSGNYRLYVGNALTGEVWPLSDYNHDINGVGKRELGAGYTPLR